MSRRHARRFAALTAGLLATSLALSGTASAHEGRRVGKYEFDVGFGEEPAYAGQKNSVLLFLSTAGDHRPVVDLGDTLKVTVEKDGQTLPLEMEPNFEVGEFGIPGDYRAWFFPTRPGKYTFHFTGSIKGQQVDETFTSGPTGFDEVKAATDVQFPAKDPSTADLGQRLDREIPRLNSALAVQDEALRDELHRARWVGWTGVALGTAGLLVALVGFIRTERRKA